jgi:hypothetical protein
MNAGGLFLFDSFRLLLEVYFCILHVVPRMSLYLETSRSFPGGKLSKTLEVSFAGQLVRRRVSLGRGAWS